MNLSRLLLGVAACCVVAGCNGISTPDPALSARDAKWMALIPDPPREDLSFNRYVVADHTGQPPGTIVVDTQARHLYFVMPGRKAMRYGVAVGDEAYGWKGVARVGRKAEWPSWNPSAEMRRRWPHVHSMEGGPMNPLGARALYLYQGDRDTLYRIHGTNEPESIGRAASSGCIRMRNIDIVDLYGRVGPNAKVIVM